MLLTTFSHLSAVVISLATLCSHSVAADSHDRRASHAPGHWVAAWTAMPQLTEPENLPNPPFNTTGLVFANSTIRQTIHVTTPSSRIRLRISNAFGPTTLPITNVTIARPLHGLPLEARAWYPTWNVSHWTTGMVLKH